jgi:hypothetical protein
MVSWVKAERKLGPMKVSVSVQTSAIAVGASASAAREKAFVKCIVEEDRLRRHRRERLRAEGEKGKPVQVVQSPQPLLK